MSKDLYLCIYIYGWLNNLIWHTCIMSYCYSIYIFWLCVTAAGCCRNRKWRMNWKIQQLDTSLYVFALLSSYAVALYMPPRLWEITHTVSFRCQAMRIISFYLPAAASDVYSGTPLTLLRFHNVVVMHQTVIMKFGGRPTTWRNRLCRPVSLDAQAWYIQKHRHIIRLSLCIYSIVYTAL